MECEVEVEGTVNDLGWVSRYLGCRLLVHPDIARKTFHQKQ